MTTRKPDRSRQRGVTGARILGLVLLIAGSAVLILPELDKSLRPAGAVAVLAGVVVLGTQILRQLRTQLIGDGSLLEPGFRKPAHGAEGFGTSTSARLNLAAAAASATAMPTLAVDDALDAAPLTPSATPLAAREPSPSVPEPVVQTPPPPAASPPAPPQTAWGSELFDAMSARQFEAVCQALFAQGGFGTRCQSHGAAAGGGVTIWLHSRHALQGKDIPVAVAYCQQWHGHVVGIKEMHPLLTLMEKQQLKRGTLAISASYTDNARKFASDNGINALDRAGLLKLIGGRTPAQQQALLAIALQDA